MIEELPVLQQSRPPTLLEGLCSECPAFVECGGSESAPCGCMRPDQRFECGDCYLICRKRKVDGKQEDVFNVHLKDGLSMDELRLRQKPMAGLPLLIPLKTEVLARQDTLNVRWAGIDATTLFTEHKGKPVKAKRFLVDPNSVRKRMRVANGTRLIAVLNTKDAILEGFWGMKRERLRFYEQMLICGFELVTGPTFSVNTAPNALASHNVLMQMRHHRVLHELQRTSLIATPNIYWRDVRDRIRWAEWLKENDIQMITRDFSRTKNKSPFLEHLAGLIDVIKRSGRQYHVLLVGVAQGNAPEALVHLAEVGCTASIITSHPIMEAGVKGCQIQNNGGKLISLQNRNVSRQDLMLPNFDAEENYLIDIASKLEVYQAYGVQKNLIRPIKMPVKKH